MCFLCVAACVLNPCFHRISWPKNVCSVDPAESWFNLSAFFFGSFEFLSFCLFDLESSMCYIQRVFYVFFAMFLFVYFFTNCGAFCKTVMQPLKVPAFAFLFPAAFFFPQSTALSTAGSVWACVCVCVLLKAITVAVCVCNSAVTDCVL